MRIITLLLFITLLYHQIHGTTTEQPTIEPTSPFLCNCSNIGIASTFAILASTYTNTVSGTFIIGDVGYTTGPAVSPTVTGTVHIDDSTYTQAGIDQGTELSFLNSQVCTFTFAAGAIDLSTDITHGSLGLYTPGVYCITGAASVGTSGITLSGEGIFIFRIVGALNTVAASSVTVTSSSICNIWWTPTAATTMGANSQFAGTVIDDAGITIGSTVNWIDARALAFGGTISTSTDTLTLPLCPVTNQPTTSIPTSIEPTSSNPTTKQPTSEIPSSQEPTSHEPTSMEPSTNQPTINVPSSKEPTSSEPTTEHPTTEEPSTKQPSSSIPSTKQPTSNEPTTEVPTTRHPAAPPTTLPTTEEPSTEYPTTRQPTSEIPSSKQPTSSEPTSTEPTSNQPTTKLPTSKQPTSNEPTSNQPTTQLPTSEVPSSEIPTSNRPTTKQPTTEEPTTRHPAAPPTTIPTTEEPSTVKPTTKQPTSEIPTTKLPTSMEPSTHKPTTMEPSTKQPTSMEPSTNQPTSKRPTSHEPTTIEPTTEYPSSMEPNTIQPTSEKPATRHPAAPPTTQPTTKEPTTTQPTSRIPTSKQPTSNEPTTNNPTTSQPTSNHPSTNKPTLLQPVTHPITEPTSQPSKSPRIDDDCDCDDDCHDIPYEWEMNHYSYEHTRISDTSIQCDTTLDCFVYYSNDTSSPLLLWCKSGYKCIHGYCHLMGGDSPCRRIERCNEKNRTCHKRNCTNNEVCDDGIFCNGKEVCFNGYCQVIRKSSCRGICNESSKTCLLPSLLSQWHDRHYESTYDKSSNIQYTLSKDTYESVDYRQLHTSSQVEVISISVSSTNQNEVSSFTTNSNPPPTVVDDDDGHFHWKEEFTFDFLIFGLVLASVFLVIILVGFLWTRQSNPSSFGVNDYNIKVTT